MTNTLLNMESSQSPVTNISRSDNKIVHINYKLPQRLIGVMLIVLTFITPRVTGDITLSFLAFPLGVLLLMSKKKLITTKERKYIKDID